MNNRSLSVRNLARQHGAPYGSKFWLNSNGYITNEDWIIATEHLCKGLCALPVVNEHPDWWFLLTCDRFASHVNTPEALQTFAKYKIMLAKEEGDSSHVSQSYDQLPAKCDKLKTHALLDMVQAYVKSNVDQYVIAAMLCCGLKK
eukprot:2218406-Ditylum_brightwellii.AAC.1